MVVESITIMNCGSCTGRQLACDRSMMFKQGHIGFHEHHVRNSCRVLPTITPCSVQWQDSSCFMGSIW